MADEDTTASVHDDSPLKYNHSPRNFIASTPKDRHENYTVQDDSARSTPPINSASVQEILQNLPSVCQFLQQQGESSGYKTEGDGFQTHETLNSESGRTGQYDMSSKNCGPSGPRHDLIFPGLSASQGVNTSQYRSNASKPQYQHPDTLRSQTPCSTFNEAPPKIEPKIQKEKKSITTKTFAKGMMDVSLLTSNATQLRAVMSTPDHEFYTLLLWLITLSVTLQILSSVLMITSDFYKTQVKEMDRQNQRKRKILNFLSLALITVVTSLNVLISAFYSPGTVSQRQSNIPQFSQAPLAMTNKHTDL